MMIKIIALLFFVSNMAYAGAYRDTYEVEIQREIMQIQNEVDQGTASDFKIKKKAYLEKRLKKMTFVGIDAAVFTSDIKRREPVNILSSVSYKNKRVSFFTRIQNMDERKITHTWYYEGKEMFSKTFKIKSSTWRVWTNKRITKSFIGLWTVIVTDGNSKVLLERSIKVTK